MAQVLGVIVLLMLASFQIVNADDKVCNDKSFLDPCGPPEEGSACICPNDNIRVVSNNGQWICPGGLNFVCRRLDCFPISRRSSKPKKLNGEYIVCVNDDDCGQNYKCSNSNYCCRIATGKNAT
ncbi:uncharacterized protein LOC132739950 [Ruditapes philippinarum]|uniref:uncharacterized protein LOC132739950 n=1 Tax=Ruditapes philippinarum TaxID=129788 RepID=UPI00295AE4AC|nr:uncharacterized protein LOC132739950 [Ruditapes philippinarum]